MQENRTRLGRRVLRHKLAQGCAFSLHYDLFFMRGDGLSILKACSYHFLPNMCLRVASEVTLLEIPPCQTPMCGVAYSCSYVLLLVLNCATHSTQCDAARFRQKPALQPDVTDISIFGINLIHFFDFFDEKEERCSRKFDRVLCCFNPLSVTPFDSAKKTNCFEKWNVFGNGKCELSAFQKVRN